MWNIAITKTMIGTWSGVLERKFQSSHTVLGHGWKKPNFCERSGDGTMLLAIWGTHRPHPMRCMRMWSMTLQSFVNFLPHVKHSRTWFLRPVSAFKFYTFRKPLDLSKACFLIKPGFFFFLASLDYNLGAVFNIWWTSSIWASSSMSSSKKSGELQLPSQLCSSETCS